MVHDSVREELALKISPVVKKEQPVIKETPAAAPIPPSPVVSKIQETTPIMNKATSPTLVEFQNKNATLPEWRLQLQNSVRKRLDNQKSDVTVIEQKPRRTAMVTNGATALKVEAEENAEPAFNGNPQLAKALRRIEESRQKYLASEEPTPVSIPFQQTSVKQFPMMQNYSNDFAPRQEISGFAKPNIVPFSSEVKVEREIKAEKFDTNKLPPLPPPARISSSFEKRPAEPKKLEPIDDYAFEDYDFIEANEPEVVAYSEPEGVEEIEESEENEDFAPISLRFNAALFDLLICSFLSLVLLSPFMLLNGKFFSFEGFFAFLATCSIVLFIYLTTTIGFLGRSFGMRLFSLEIIDIEENAYPSLHQAAVSSSVYLLSLGLGGLGFLTMLMNSEKRAAHDLLSGTIVVKEY
jgi:uncharacterized RDD family membrane protein YckC